jgi:hypothetical protein
MSTTPDHIRVAPLMQQIERDVRSTIRRRLATHGMPAYEDERLFEHVRATLQHAADGRDLNVLLLPELVGDDVDWALEPAIRFSSHRPGFPGRAILFVKRRVLLPLTRWLFEYSQENFRRQQQINRILLACVEELAVENARLRRDVDALRR